MRSNPTRTFTVPANRIGNESGSYIDYSDSFNSDSGMVIVKFTSDADVTAAGWEFTWRATPAPKPQENVQYCTDRVYSGEDSGYFDDESGEDANYGPM